MNLKEIENAIKHLEKTYPCSNCKKKYEAKNINILATTNAEALFDMKCDNCSTATIVNILLTPEFEITEKKERTHRSISENDILDIKNFLTNFDGNFKKIFTKKK